MVAGVPGSFRTRLLLLSLLALGVRLAWLALEPATSPVADETMWLTWGTDEGDDAHALAAASAHERVDGALVGGASLKPDFVELVRRAVQAAGSPR